MLEDEELEAVALESTRTIDIDKFVPAEFIDWIWYDTPHYLIPDDDVGAGGLLGHPRRDGGDRTPSAFPGWCSIAANGR